MSDEAILARIRAIPPGFVRAYGDVSPGAPRRAGAVLHDTDEPDLPWWRVVRADGSLAQGDRQRALLEDEGVPFRPRERGFHLITREVLEGLPELREVRVGLLHLFIRHTSASLTLNENASPDVRDDFETWFNDAVDEDFRGWTHTFEGPDDMPAHIKASLLGPSLSLPVSDGGLALGTWQGVYLCEHRDRGGARSLVATLQGDAG